MASILRVEFEIVDGRFDTAAAVLHEIASDLMDPACTLYVDPQYDLFDTHTSDTKGIESRRIGAVTLLPLTPAKPRPGRRANGA